MGNSLSFFIKHGRRLKNRYNAQYRAIEFISKENRPNAPRHVVPAQGVVEDSSLFQELQKKDLKLDEYLKDVYIQSCDKEAHDSSGNRNNPERPLPQSRDPRPNAIFAEPEEVEKGRCTITHISEFLAKHEEDPEKNNVAAIAEKYGLEEKKVENTLKYFSVFRIFDRVRDTIPKDEVQYAQTMEEGINEVRAGEKKILNYRKSMMEGLGDGGEKQSSAVESDDGSQPVEKRAVKN